MISLFSRRMDNFVDRQFRTDQSGRLVFLPFGSKGKAYFVDSKSEEGKIRSFLKMYRSASALFSSLGFLSVFVPVWTRLISAGASPLGDKFQLLLGAPRRYS